MNRIHLFLTAALLLIILSCADQEAEYSSPKIVRDIAPVPQSGITTEDTYDIDPFDAEQLKPFIEIGKNEILLSIINVNLDLDKADEQIVVLRDRENPEKNIYIAVADFNNVTNTYARSWQGETGANNIRSFIVSLDDLVGDHVNEIVCSGRDAEGKSTLDIFWKSNNSSNNLLSFLPIFNISQRGTIDIIQQERSKAYEQGLKEGVSYKIAVTREESDSSGSYKLIQTNYYWDFPLKRYLKLDEEVIESEAVVKRQLSEVIEGSEDEFSHFLQGPWYKSQNSRDDKDLIVFFDSDIQSMTFFSDNIQEIYSWVNSYKILSNMLYIRSRNQVINYIENEIYIKITDIDEINVTVRDIDNHTRVKNLNDIWTGNYIRMKKDMKDKSLKTLESVLSGDNLPVLSGQYISDSGEVIEFYGSDFWMKTADENIAGMFSVFEADKNILSLKVRNEAGLIVETRSFSFNFTEEKDEKNIKRVLVLSPGRLGVSGFQLSDTDLMRFVQNETLEVPSEE